MKSWHFTIKYAAIALAVILIISIASGIMHILSFFISTFTPNVTGEYKTYEIENDIDILDIDIHSIDIEVKTTTNSEFRVESNYNYLIVKEKENKLLIEDKKAFYLNLDGKAMITLYIPENKMLDKVEIRTGAGSTDLKNIKTKLIDMQLGAGEAILQNVSASDEAFIETGAGKLSIRDSKLHNLDLDMGVGQFEFSGILLGKNSLKMGVGSSQIDLTGSLDDYTLNIEKGLGDIYVGEDNLKKNTQLGQGDSKLFFEGGVGSVRIDFSE
ncbi:MAG TPA: DUF4097 domain-containing protein [Clostridiaceae bacterium]|nr:DUF4097 domain-containing protein [Clostridiaceae bacterium]